MMSVPGSATARARSAHAFVTRASPDVHEERQVVAVRVGIVQEAVVDEETSCMRRRCGPRVPAERACARGGGDRRDRTRDDGALLRLAHMHVTLPAIAVRRDLV